MTDSFVAECQGCHQLWQLTGVSSQRFCGCCGAEFGKKDYEAGDGAEQPDE